MRRAALMQCPGDPFVVSYWLRNFDRVWGDTVDQLDILINGQSNMEIREAIIGMRHLVNVPGKLSFVDGRLIHGQGMRALVEACTADLVLLIEDDAYVRDGAAVDNHFADIEMGVTDVYATPRGGMDPEIEAFARAKWADENMTAPEDCDPPSNGPGLWPCFVFARLSDLMATTRRFESLSWYPGDVIPGLGYEVKDREQTTDSFTATAFELRAAGLRITPSVQYKELWQKTLPAGGAPWFHSGGLSNGDFLTPGWDGGGSRPDLGGTNEGLDWAHRIFWWTRCLDTAPADLFPELRGHYQAQLDALTMKMGVAGEVEQWGEKILPWINWDDQG